MTGFEIKYVEMLILLNHKPQINCMFFKEKLLIK